MKITCREYNRRWKEKNLGYVVRLFFNKWIVCDGYAPDCDTEIDENSIFIGNIVKTFDNIEQANEFRNLLNAKFEVLK